MAKESTKADRKVDFNSDRYPTAQEGLRRVLDEGDWAKITVDRIEVRFQANGEGTYRYWSPRAEEPEMGFLPSQET